MKWTTTSTDELVTYVGAALLAGKTQLEAYEEFAKENNRTIGSLRTKYQLSKPAGVTRRGPRKDATIENPRSGNGVSGMLRYNGEDYIFAAGTSLRVVWATVGYLKDGGTP